MCSDQGFKSSSIFYLGSCTMDQWELNTGSHEQPANKMAVGPDKQQVNKALHLIGRLCLKNALEVREL